MFDRLLLILLGIWAVLFGILAVTNVKIEYGQVICGFAALGTGVVCLIRAFNK